ncbi:thioesterase family protein [Leucobacter sp. UCMA 4100]|uniref:thioesterase family protein n=1 Tax=Leucobacter sp. UCMA 4100 TaxID=2810534 RepID=UPI0022EB6FD4|nr:thioesterase family protein [Leucobacter sp. UCMA 4100]MDA3147275.1 thioesterase family protein [Leucobacter sp. UCMA 4100]
MPEAQSYFTRVSAREFAATPLVGGAWKSDEQHIAAPMGLLAHLIEQDHARRGGSLALSRVTYDILGVIPLDVCEVDVRVVRPGRTIELVEATLSHGGRAALVARAWMLSASDTSALEGTALEALPGRDTMQPWAYSNDWKGEFVRSIETYRDQEEPGRARGWARAGFAILDSEPSSFTARMLGVIDTANGLTPREDPAAVMFPNLDLTVSLVREPVSEWAGYDTRVTFGAGGRGLTQTILHDEAGPIGQVSQTLTVRPMPQ